MMTFLTTTTVPVASAPRRRLFGLGWLAAAGLALAIPVSAQAGSGYLSVSLNLRAGPSIDYPVVRLAPRGTAVYVYGCVDDYGWCDVSWGGNRGWVSGEYLDYDYYDRRVPVIDYGPRLGLGLISFSFGNYWNSHYRHQSWYGQRNHYSRVVVRHGAPRHHGYNTPRHNTRTANHYDRRDHRQDNRRDVRRDSRNDRRDVRNDDRHDRRDVRQDRREVRADVRTGRNDARNVRQDSRQPRQQARQDQRQVSQQSRNVRQDSRPQSQQTRSVAHQGKSSDRNGSRKER